MTSITQAMEAVLQNDGITGDGQKKLGLPIIPGNHNDLNIISPETLAGLIGGKYSESIGSYRIIDCRYPYEFDGGHIQVTRHGPLHVKENSEIIYYDQ